MSLIAQRCFFPEFLKIYDKEILFEGEHHGEATNIGENEEKSKKVPFCPGYPGSIV
jgi:hypothetical protein